MPPVARDQLLVIEAIRLARLVADSLERLRERRDAEVRDPEAAQRDVIVDDALSARTEQRVDALGLRRHLDVVGPQAREQRFDLDRHGATFSGN